MKYGDLDAVRRLFDAGGNVMAQLRGERAGEAGAEVANDPETIEIAYDLQAGSYIDHHTRHASWHDAYVSELAAVLAPLVGETDSILDCGTGELTTFSRLAARACGAGNRLYAFDLSVSRLFVGKAFAAQAMSADLYDNLVVFCAEFSALPLSDASIDVVVTNHALEPNGGREEQILGELMRVARKRLVLFEPSYEHNSAEGRARMEQFGYVRALPRHIAACGARLDALVKIEAAANPLNPTYAHVVTPPRPASSSAAGMRLHDSPLACPIMRDRLEQGDGYLIGSRYRIAYPVFDGIPVLRPDVGVIASKLPGFPLS